jgi:hypothetical protein
MLDGAFLWTKFCRWLKEQTEVSILKATVAGGILSEICGMEVLESRDISEAICSWARCGNALVVITEKSSWSDEFRKYVMKMLWTVLETGGARRWINDLGCATADSNRYPPLHVACAWSPTALTTLLLDCPELDINKQSSNGETAIFFCVRHRQLTAFNGFELLLKHRLSELDLVTCAPDGKSIDDKIKEMPAGADGLDDNYRAAWHAAVHWLKTRYYPSINEILTLNLLPPIALIIDFYLRPTFLIQ